jgi:ectoine hydroxylase-related dioxygenase (phytanoyl-CoA dioxygenase family)
MAVATAPSLTADQKRHLRELGYVRVPGAVDTPLVERALRAINWDLGRGIDPAKLPIYQSQTFCPAVTATPAITDLFERSSARAVAESAIGPVHPVGSGQCALRWPRPPEVAEAKPGAAHIDGTYAPNNGVPAGEIHNFTALACVLLSDVPRPDSGNFTVWPGSHLVHERYFREHGAQALLQSPKLDLGAPAQITGRAGDLIIAHYLLGHTVAANLSPHVRYAVFFRLNSTALTSANRLGAVTDAWRDWAGMGAA